MEVKEITPIDKANAINDLDENITKALGNTLEIRGLLRVIEKYDNFKNPEYIEDNDTEKLFMRRLYKEFPNILDGDRKFIWKIERCLKTLPRHLDLDDIMQSIRYNLEYDFQKLLDKFPLKTLEIELSDTGFHEGMCNQMRFTYTPKKEWFLACFDCFFICENGKKRLVINSIQGELTEPKFDLEGNNISLDNKKQKRFIQKMYGILSKELGCDDRGNGIVERIKEFGKEENIETIGLLPPCFGSFGPRETDYVNYRFKYLYYYVDNDIETDNSKQYDKFHIPFNEILEIIKTCDKEESLAIISSFKQNLVRFRRGFDIDLNETNHLVDLFESILRQIRDIQDKKLIPQIIQNECKKLENLIMAKEEKIN